MTPGKMHKSLLRNLPLPATKEDQIQQDCSFLYRPVQEDNHHSPQRKNNNHKNKNNHRLRAVVELPPNGVSTLYRDAQDVLAPPDVAQYQARFQQLNQEYARQERDRFENYNDYDIDNNNIAHELALEEQRHTSHVVTSGTLQSSLFFQNASNGRVAMRLPRDHVHLLVAAPHDSPFPLEPGILSVIQCRHPDDPPSKQLEYCLTVPPNLYQRVVSEMNQYNNHGGGVVNHHHHRHVGGGLDSSFYASDHADIRVAVGILVIIMAILGINTLVFGLN
jgi:hypothetical protein